MTVTEEKVFLVGVTRQPRLRKKAEHSFAELHALVKTAGALCVGEEMCEARKIVAATFLGTGTIERIGNRIAEMHADLVIFDVDLSPTQTRNLSETWNVQVIDRAGLILDIFAMHATSREGKLQVELAQYEYLYPRLTGAWSHFSRQRGGGVGLRGPGETQLEVDRRLVREKMVRLKKALSKVSLVRDLHRKKRGEIPLPTVTLVGYTNAGKSTLFNAVMGASQLAEDKLFATLDPKIKKRRLPSGRTVLFSDTVGFIRNLPHQLIEAFQSTFEGIKSSQLLIHVIDGADPNYRQLIEVVESVLAETGLGEIPVIRVFNKKDHPDFCAQADMTPDDVGLSATQKEGVDDLLQKIESVFAKTGAIVRLCIPYEESRHIHTLYDVGRVLSRREDAKGVHLEVELDGKWTRKFEGYVES